MKRFKRAGISCLLYILSFCLVSLAREQTVFGEEKTEVIFLLDTSSSMNDQDRERLVMDSVRQLVYSLPMSCDIGFVAYNTTLQSVIALGTGREQLVSHLDTVKYSGYTNAGEGLNQAVELFSDKENVNRYIVMISDGEIDMPDQQAKELSRAVYAEAAGRAGEKGIKIFILAVGSEMSDPQMHIFDGAEQTDGAIYWEGQNGTAAQIMDQLISSRFLVKRKSVGMTGAGGGSFNIELPGTGAGTAKIILTSSRQISHVTADYTAASGRIVTGQRFAVVELTEPEGKQVNIQFQADSDSEVNAYLMTEIPALVKAQVFYTRKEKLLPDSQNKGARKNKTEYENFAHIIIRAADVDGKNNDLWNNNYYQGMEIPFTVNGKQFHSVIQDGALTCTVPADGIDQLKVAVDTSAFQEIYYLEQPVKIAVAIPPDPEPEKDPDYRPLWAVIGTLAISLAFILLLWARKSRTTVIYVAQPLLSGKPKKKIETKSCTYSGKINLYVVRTENGRDVPPQTYRLFGRKPGPMALGQILNSCGLRLGRIGAEDIIIYPGPDRSLIMMDQSEHCTVMRGTEILKKGMGYPVFYSEKITVTFGDELTEMEIHYKNLKPSEREGI